MSDKIEKIENLKSSIDKYQQNISKAEKNIKQWKDKLRTAEEKLTQLQDAGFMEIIHKSGISLERFEELINLETTVSDKVDVTETAKDNDIDFMDFNYLSAESEDAILSQSEADETEDW